MNKKQITEYPEYYAREDGLIENKDGRVLNTWVDNVGYKQIVLYKDGKRNYLRVHRLIAKAFIDNPYNKKQVDHIDGNKLNNSIENLEWVTNAENTKRGYDNGVYLSKKRVEVLATSKETNNTKKFYSIRECSAELKINRKTLSSIIKSGKPNNTDYSVIVNGV